MGCLGERRVAFLKCKSSSSMSTPSRVIAANVVVWICTVRGARGSYRKSGRWQHEGFD